jgi:hypothetical protein
MIALARCTSCPADGLGGTKYQVFIAGEPQIISVERERFNADKRLLAAFYWSDGDDVVDFGRSRLLFRRAMKNAKTKISTT